MSVRTVPIEPLDAWAQDDAWRRKLRADAHAIGTMLPPEVRHLHERVAERAKAGAVKALILSGSTARACRTEISDVDYHLIGERIETGDLSRELDLHVLSEDKLVSEILRGDDFVQWSLRFGAVVIDDGTIRRALQLIRERRPWPDIERKRDHAAKSLELAGRFVSTGDQDGALVQVRTALSLAARARLLSEGTFPLARAELPAQLETIGCSDAASALSATIYGSPALAELDLAVSRGVELLAALGWRSTGEATNRWS